MATPTSKSVPVHCHSFFLKIEPFPTERTKCACRGRGGGRAFPTVYSSAAYKQWLADAVELLAAEAEGLDFSAVRDSPVTIHVEVWRRRPKTTKLFAPLGDNDNYEKGLWDAISKAGHWWADDRQIVDNRTIKRWAEGDEPEGYRVGIEFNPEEKFSR